MDEEVREPATSTLAVDERGPGMPPEAPGAMPSQLLATFDEAARRESARRVRSRGTAKATARRVLVLGATLGLAAFATSEMWLALSVSHVTALSVVVLILFAVNVSWISLPCVTSLIGFVRIVGRRARPALHPGPLSTRTALVVPMHNEDPVRVGAALDAMAHDLVRRGEGQSFDLFLLSDTTSGDIALAEEEVVWTLRRRLRHRIDVYYRRRAENVAHKPGNLRDFCERWGSRYDHLLLLDADSIMDGATMVRLAHRMEDSPGVGLIQTLPRLHGGRTLLARLQQFAAWLYGSVLGSGLAWWSMDEATFWGHNAILRTEAFMSSAGLPVLSGKPPFGGAILSHDFVEAALLRRRGWSVVIADDLTGSYEECPATLVDQAIRDRRWCQGNLQHARVVGAKGLHWVSRFHLLAGMMSYLSSPIWLLFVISGLALGVQYEFARHQYFTHVPTLFPLWPRIDPARALRLFGLTMGILFGPKVLGWLAVAARRDRRREGGGLFRIAPGFLFEVVLSALLAPIIGLIHCGIVADVLLGRSSGWRAQRRDGAGLPWGVVLRAHRWHVVAGFALAAIAYSISWQMLAWLTPAVVGMILAPPLSKLVASARAGQLSRRLGLLRTPEETDAPPIVRAADSVRPVYESAVARAPGLVDLLRDETLLRRHLALMVRIAPRRPGEVDPVEATAEKKIRDAGAVREAIALLTDQERARALAVPSLLHLLVRLATTSSAAASVAPSAASEARC